MKAALFFAAALAAFAAAGAGDEIFRSLREGRRDEKATLSLVAELANATNSYRLTFANLKAHGKEPRRFEMAVDNGLQSGFTKLVSAFALSVNGIDARRLQPGRDAFREWEGGNGEQGVAISLNFDGARIDVRFSMNPDSPVLWGEVAMSPDAIQLTPVTNVAVIVKAVPSFLDCAPGRKTRFFGYARQVRTATRLLSLPPNRTELLLPDDGFIVFQDAEYDGSADGKGMGPSATWPLEPVSGRITLNDGWTTWVEYRPDLSRPFRFALLEYRAHRTPNGNGDVRQ